MSPSAKRVAAIAGGTLALGGAVAVVGVLDPNAPGHLPSCPSLALTGWWCPFCGGLRAVHALVHGDPTTALARNPLVPLFVVFVAWVWWSQVRAAWAGERWAGVSSRATTVALGLLAVFAVARNLPGAEWLSPV